MTAISDLTRRYLEDAVNNKGVADEVASALNLVVDDSGSKTVPGAKTFSGAVTLDGGATVPSGDTLTAAAGSTVTLAGTNTISGATTVSAAMTFSSAPAINAVPTTTSGIGAANGTGVAASEKLGMIHHTTITLTNHAMALADEAGVVAYKGSKVYDFPEGHLVILGASTDLAITKSSAGVNDDWDGDFSMGSVTASNNGTLSSTEADVIPSTATPQAVAGATTADGQSTNVAIFDGTATAVDLYLNFLVDDADHDVTGTACNLIVNGTIGIIWAVTGDN